MDRNGPRGEEQREQHVKVGQCENLLCDQGTERVWVLGSSSGPKCLALCPFSILGHYPSSQVGPGQSIMVQEWYEHILGREQGEKSSLYPTTDGKTKRQSLTPLQK